MTAQPDTQYRTAHTDHVLDLCAASGIDALDTIEAENGVVRVRIAPLLVSFEDVNRTLTRRMVEYGWYYGVGFSAVFEQHASELTFEPMAVAS